MFLSRRCLYKKHRQKPVKIIFNRNDFAFCTLQISIQVHVKEEKK